MTDRPTAEFKIMLKGLTDDELFARWSAEYDSRHTEFVDLCIKEIMLIRLPHTNDGTY